MITSSSVPRMRVSGCTMRVESPTPCPAAWRSAQPVGEAAVREARAEGEPASPACSSRLSRRGFLRNSWLAGAAVLLGPAVGMVASATTADDSVAAIAFDRFQAAVGTRFDVRAEVAPGFELELVEASRSGRTASNDAGPSHERFSLLFRGSGERPLDQRIHWLGHPRLGRFSVFLVPVLSRDRRYQRYEAVFNRSASATGAPRSPSPSGPGANPDFRD